jgi:hypothetical protein
MKDLSLSDMIRHFSLGLVILGFLVLYCYLTKLEFNQLLQSLQGNTGFHWLIGIGAFVFVFVLGSMLHYIYRITWYFFIVTLWVNTIGRVLKWNTSRRYLMTKYRGIQSYTEAQRITTIIKDQYYSDKYPAQRTAQNSAIHLLHAASFYSLLMFIIGSSINCSNPPLFAFLWIWIGLGFIADIGDSINEQLEVAYLLDQVDKYPDRIQKLVEDYGSAVNRR